ncbi:MAG: catalase-related domain-containing protein [Pseudomonadota bacterium]
MDAAQQRLLFENTARQLRGTGVAVQERHISNCAKADPAYGEGIRKALDQISG